MASAFHDNPEWDGKVYLYLCVRGQSLKPNPADSYPTPDWFQTKQYEHGMDDYDVIPKGRDRSTAGFFMRHEASHYEPNLILPSHNEHDTDHLALDGIHQAWEKYQASGDTSGYPFVFVTDKGITITKNLADKQPVETV